jgi:hypothetical protein
MVLVLWAVAVLLSLVGIGHYIDEAITGIDPAQRSTGLPIAALAVAVIAIVATILWARRLGAASPDAVSSVPARRRFLVGAAATTGGLIAGGAAAFVRPLGWLTITSPSITPETPTSDPNPHDE